jgi:hypothetical protein
MSEISMVIKTSRQGKPTRSTAFILSVPKIPHGKMKGGKTIGTISPLDR